MNTQKAPSLFLLIFVLAASVLFAQPKLEKKPKLVVMIAVDQFRYDYLNQFSDQYTGGLKRLLTQGAVFDNAHLAHYPTVTAIGHATMLTGATPAFSGIVGNDWFDREEKKTVTSVSDSSVKKLGGAPGEGASPHRLLVSTVGDEMKMLGNSSPKVIGISLKDRAAILPSGHMADAAYWYDTKTGDFISSTFYFNELPQWVRDFNSRREAVKFAGARWNGNASQLPSASDSKLFSAIYSSPFGNDLLEKFVEEAIQREKLGQRNTTDLLTISFSSNDAVGHAFGPDSSQARDITLHTDRTFERLFAYLDKTVGLPNVLIIFTADHAVAPVPEKNQERKMPGGRLAGSQIVSAMQSALEAKFGPGKWVISTAGTSPYFNYELIQEKKLDRSEIQKIAAQSIAEQPHILRVFTRDQLLLGQVPSERFSQRVVRSFNARRSGDLEILLDPYWILSSSSSGTTHGTPYLYDSHIPLVFMGPNIKPGRYPEEVILNDLAPTLATILRVGTPSGSIGRVLSEMLQ